ncbi:hypothetical protein [Morganella morganii]|uniref:hypothetical protein n=1 Tax=Morganella morganii TaxID=582 RepID=UPI003D7F325C
MGDMGDIFRAMRENAKERKQQRLKENTGKLSGIDIPFIQDGGGTIHFSTPAGKVLFYPTTNKIQHKQNVTRGNLEKAVSLAKSLGA